MSAVLGARSRTLARRRRRWRNLRALLCRLESIALAGAVLAWFIVRHFVGGS